MKRPTLEQAIQAANELMNADDAISSVNIEFETSTGLAFTATYSGFIRNVERIKETPAN
jgi:hypothetical protein